MHRSILFFATLGLYFLTIDRIYGQLYYKPTELRYWVQGGLGVSAVKFSNSDVGFSLAFGLTAEYNRNLLSLKFHRETELVFFEDPEEFFSCADILYGRRMDFKSKGILYPFIKKEMDYTFTYSIGLSLASGSRRKALVSSMLFDSRYTTESFKTIGIPIDLELVHRFTDNIGLGTGLYCNINDERMFYGIRSNLYIGIF